MSESKNAPAQEQVRLSKYNAEYRRNFPNIFMKEISAPIRRIDMSENSDYSFLYVVAGHELEQGPDGKMYPTATVIDRIILPSHRWPEGVESPEELIGAVVNYRYLKPARKVGASKQKVAGETYTVYADESRKTLNQVEVTEWFDRVDWNSIRFEPVNAPKDEEVDAAIEQTEKVVKDDMPWQ